MKDYHSSHAVAFDRDEEFQATGYLSLPILPYLIGQPWGPEALAYVGTVRPRAIRVTTGAMKMDAMTGRVTVIVDEHDIIEEIEQEVSIGLPDGFDCGADFHLHELPPRSTLLASGRRARPLSNN